MKKTTIKINNSDNIQKFCRIISKFENDVDLISGRYVIDGKSIMGIFSLDLSLPIIVEIFGDHGERVIDALSDYVIDTENQE